MRKMAVRLGLALAILAAAGGAYAWWRSTRPRILTVWVLTDYAFRQRPDWEKAIRGRFDEVNRLFAQGTGVQWKIVDLDRADPTAQQPGISDRRRSLEQYPEFRADLIAGFTGLQATGPAS